jgi:hypothetical protein
MGSVKPSPMIRPLREILDSAINVAFYRIDFAKTGMKCPAKDSPVIYKGFYWRFGQLL